MCIRSGPVGRVSYRDSGISTLRFPLVFVVAHCFVSAPSSAIRMLVVFRILFVVVRARCVVIVFLLFPPRVVVYVCGVPLFLRHSIVGLLRSFGLRCSSVLVMFVTRFQLLFSYRRLVGTSLSCTVRMSV